MKTRYWSLFAAVLALLVGLSTPAMSQERDADGTRMQARQVDVGSVHSDRLAPPDETADWRMVRLEEETTLELELTVQTSERSADLTLTQATGDELDSTTANGDGATIHHTLEAGIYYIAVTSSEELEYRLSIE